MHKKKSIFIVLVAMLAACNSSPAQPPTPTVMPTPTEVVQMQGVIPFQSCRLQAGISALCGTFSVLENQDAPEGRQIDLRVVILPATMTPVEPDPVFFLAGGPGGAATEHWLSSTSMFPGLNRYRDIVLIDQRGTGGSHKIEYPPIPGFNGFDSAKIEEVMQAWAAKALTGVDADPRYYTTAIAMDDVDEVRAALGYDKINIYGGSYGATAAQVYLRRHESHVRSVVLDGGSLLDLHMMEPWGRDAQRSLELMFARCEADADCSSAFPSVRQEFSELIARLRQAPITVHDSESGRTTLLTPWAMEALAQAALQDVNQIATLAKNIHDIYEIVKSAKENELTAPLVIEFSEGPTLMMSWSVLCNEYWARRDLEETALLNQGTFFEEWVMDGARKQDAVCGVVPPGLAEEDAGMRVRSDVPVLILNGEADPQNPPANVANAQQELPNSLTLIVPGAGHTVGHLGCLPRVVVDFIERGSVGGLDAECVRQYSPPPFELPD